MNVSSAHSKSFYKGLEGLHYILFTYQDRDKENRNSVTLIKSVVTLVLNDVSKSLRHAGSATCSTI